MLNDSTVVDCTVFGGVTIDGQVNTSDDVLVQQIASAIRRGHPQICPEPPKPDRVVLVGGGPSLETTFVELRDLVWQGAKLITVNGAYQWCLAHNLRPSAQIVMDARASNAKFVEPAVPHCRYFLASQCHPDTWDAVAGRDVRIWHATMEQEGPTRELLDRYYCQRWFGIAGGTTVITRALSLLRLGGFLRFSLFGVDSCVFGDETRHHAYAQPENDADRLFTVSVHPTDHPQVTRTFRCTAWQLKQAEDMCQMVAVNGDHFLLSVHGNGMIAYMIQSGADAISVTHNGEASIKS